MKGLKSQIAPCIWDLDKISKKVTNPALVHLESQVATDEHKQILEKILRNGEKDPGKRDLYSRNYEFFSEQWDNYWQNNAPQWQHFCVALLDRVIILPIECERFDQALTIFMTLNNRGMPLSDSDIFKAEIYKSKNGSKEEQLKFTKAWKDLTETVERAEMSLDDLFRYYTHIIRANSGDTSKEIALRSFYAGEKKERLKAPNLMEELSSLGAFWVDIAKRRPELAGKKISRDTLKRLHCLECYPNEFWKYPACVFYFKHKDCEDFGEQFCSFLNKLIAFLFSEFVANPTVNAIKDKVYKLCVNLEKGQPLSVGASVNGGFRLKLAEAADGRLARALILLQAYLNDDQVELLPKNFDIEHIFPRRWQNTSYNGWTENDATASLERFGNKVAIEKKVNIQAGNGYFARKKKIYSDKSKVAEVVDLSKLEQDDWSKADIENREKEFLDDIVKFFDSHPSTVGWTA